MSDDVVRVGKRRKRPATRKTPTGRVVNDAHSCPGQVDGDRTYHDHHCCHLTEDERLHQWLNEQAGGGRR